MRIPPLLSVATLLAGLLIVSCGDDESASPVAAGSGGTAGSSGGGHGGSSGVGGEGGSGSLCDPDPLFTGETDPPETDSYDCLVLTMTEKYAEPDAMIFKAMMRIESHFKNDAAGCTAPCGTPEGWSAAEVRCLGLMQIVLACNPEPGDLGLLPNGHPNMTLDPSSPDWAGSIFNPAVNIERGIAGVAGNRQQVKEQFPGCTEEQYTLMAIGNYNHYGSTKSCTEYNKEYDDLVLQFYHQYSEQSGWTPHY